MLLTITWIKIGFKKRVIAFQKILYPHDPTTIYNNITKVFTSCGVTEKVLSLTFDNASANNAPINLFKRTLETATWKYSFSSKCACRIINLSVQDGMKHFESYLDNI